jgi:hypothetical protein
MVIHPSATIAHMLAAHYTHLIRSEQPAATLELEEVTP